MENKQRGSRGRDWLDQELKTPAFKEGVEKARARRRVAQQIYEARKRAGVSQPELARRPSISGEVRPIELDADFPSFDGKPPLKAVVCEV